MLKIFSIFLIFSSLYAQTGNYPKREMRGAWIATVGNIDWPSSGAISTGEQIAELKYILDNLKDSGINTVFFQIRTECDALYNSSIEPWSYWLTGKQGRAPEPYYDPLELVVNEAHSRGMKLFAWMNPYRAVRVAGDYSLSSSHVSVRHPEWILKFKKYKILNPGLPEVQDYITSVVEEVVKNYDIDGIVFDDYFYPYSPKVKNEDVFAFNRYSGGVHNIHDWRRRNINMLVSRVNNSIKTIKPYVKFGISPFGIVQNHYAGTKGLSSFDVLYSDPLTWLKEKSIDFITPQIYWEIGKDIADYKDLLNWWASIAGDRHLYIGQYASRFTETSYKDKAEIGRQILLNRKTDNVHGSVFFSAKSIFNNMSGFADTLKRSYYRRPALLPLMQWIDSIPPLAPVDLKVEKKSSGVTLTWESPSAAADGNYAHQYVVYKFHPYEKNNIGNPKNIVAILNSSINTFSDSEKEDSKVTYVVTALDRLQNESKPAAVVSDE